MPHLGVIQLMRVIKWLRSDLDGSCMNKNVHGNKWFFSKCESLINVYDAVSFGKSIVLPLYSCSQAAQKHTTKGLDQF